MVPKDYIQQLADYIKKNLRKGYTPESLKVSLTHQGYSKISIQNALELANKQLATTAPKMKEKPQITYKVITDKKEPVKQSKPKSKRVKVPEKSFLEKIKSFFKL